jgi:hypothetical protein
MVVTQSLAEARPELARRERPQAAYLPVVENRPAQVKQERRGRAVPA